MPMSPAIIAPPSEDKRWRLISATMRRHGYVADALIETLHTVQESFGYLDMPALRYVATVLHVPLSRVYGVATFYHFFSLRPKGAHTCVLCLGTACYIKGSTEILEAFKTLFQIRAGETTADGKLSLLSARCLGSCGLAPAAVFDAEVVGKLTAQEAISRVQEWTDHDA